MQNIILISNRRLFILFLNKSKYYPFNKVRVFNDEIVHVSDEKNGYFYIRRKIDYVGRECEPGSVVVSISSLFRNIL